MGRLVVMSSFDLQMPPNPDRAAWRTPDDRRDGVWPRVYRPRRRIQILFAVSGVFTAIWGLGVAVWLLFLPPSAGSSGAQVAFALMCAGMAVGGAYFVASAYVSRLLLWQDAVEFVELTCRRRFRLCDIAGFRRIAQQNGVKLVIEPLEPGQKPFATALVWNSDEVLEAWMARLTDLDARESEKHLSELLAARALGTTDERRRQALSARRKQAHVANGVALAVSLWGIFIPRPYPLVVGLLILVPLGTLGLLVSGRGTFSASDQHNEVRPKLMTPLLLPGFALLFRSLFDLQLVDYMPLPVIAALGVLIWTAALAIGDPAIRRRRIEFAMFALFSAPLSWGGCAEANVLLDRSPAHAFATRVAEKYVDRKPTAYMITIEPWGDSAGGSVSVSKDLHRDLSVGDTVCVRLHEGALGAGWLDVARCK